MAEPRKRLTPHQREVYERIVKKAARTGWADARDIGSRGAVSHLVEKGYVEWDPTRIHQVRPRAAS